MFQSKYSFKIGDRDLAVILVHVKYRTYTHFTILALLHIEDWMTDCKSMKFTEKFAGMHGSARECTRVRCEFQLDFCTIFTLANAAQGE